MPLVARQHKYLSFSAFLIFRKVGKSAASTERLNAKSVPLTLDPAGGSYHRHTLWAHAPLSPSPFAKS